MSAEKRKIEIFSAGCAVCEATTALVGSMACGSCEVTVLEMQDAAVASRARQLGIRAVPAVVIDGKLASCCAGRGVSAEVLKAAGVGQPLPAYP